MRLHPPRPHRAALPGMRGEDMRRFLAAFVAFAFLGTSLVWIASFWRGVGKGVGQVYFQCVAGNVWVIHYNTRISLPPGPTTWTVVAAWRNMAWLPSKTSS